MTDGCGSGLKFFKVFYFNTKPCLYRSNRRVWCVFVLCSNS